MSPLHRRPLLHPLLFWTTAALAVGALVHRRPSICWPPVPTTRRPSFHFALATVNLVTTDVPHHFVAGKLLYGLRRRRSRCTFPHCMFSRNVYLPPASRPVHRRPLMFWPPTPVDLLLKVVAHHCCP